MAGASLLTLIDDIASVLDDVAVLTKVAAKKTAGVLGDDLALNAEQVTGLATAREWPVVWEVAKGSARNKLILVPLALALSALAPWAVQPLLMLGGAYLGYEGVEKLVHKWLHRKERRPSPEEHLAPALMPAVDLVALERDKIRGAIRTDVILSAEIIVITLGTITDQPFSKRVAVLATVAVLMTVGVYGFVALVVKLDDAGLALSRAGNGFSRGLGRGLLWVAPLLMKGLSLVGTAAMFLVGGGILVHGLAPLHHLAEALSLRMPFARWLGPLLVDACAGIAAGVVGLLLVTLGKRIFGRRKASGGAH